MPGSTRGRRSGGRSRQRQPRAFLHDLMQAAVPVRTYRATASPEVPRCVDALLSVQPANAPCTINEGVGVPTEETRYKVMRLLERNPKLSQRDVARELGVSLGKVNFCVRALVRRGWIKASNFKNSHNKAAYMYVLTPRGLEAKARLAVRFLGIKISEYEKLRVEIEQIRQEAERDRPR